MAIAQYEKITASDINEALSSFCTKEEVVTIVLEELRYTSTWRNIQYNIKSGLGESYYPLGTKFVVYKPNNGTTIGDLVKYELDVVAHNKHFKKDSNGNPTATYSMTLQFHNLLNDYMQFDAKEDLYGLSLDTSVVSWKTYYSDTSGTVVSSPSGSPKDNGYYEQNHSSRISYGNNCWRTSGLRAWLNADPTLAAGAWWQKQHACDTAPDYSSYLPFQAMLKESDGQTCGLLSVVGEVTIDYILSTVKRPDATGYYLDCDANGDYSSSRLTYDTVNDKFYLPSNKEVYMSSFTEPNGVILDYYQVNSSLGSPSDNADTNRVKTKQNSTSSDWWWLRSSCSDTANYVCSVSGSGSSNGHYAYNTSPGAVPLCTIY